MSEDASLKIETVEVEGMVRVRTDRPGERATSAVVDGRALIAQIEEALGITREDGAPA